MNIPPVITGFGSQPAINRPASTTPFTMGVTGYEKTPLSLQTLQTRDLFFSRTSPHAVVIEFLNSRRTRLPANLVIQLQKAGMLPFLPPRNIALVTEKTAVEGLAEPSSSEATDNTPALKQETQIQIKSLRYRAIQSLPLSLGAATLDLPVNPSEPNVAFNRVSGEVIPKAQFEAKGVAPVPLKPWAQALVKRAQQALPKTPWVQLTDTTLKIGSWTWGFQKYQTAQGEAVTLHTLAKLTSHSSPVEVLESTELSNSPYSPQTATQIQEFKSQLENDGYTLCSTDINRPKPEQAIVSAKSLNPFASAPKKPFSLLIQTAFE